MRHSPTLGASRLTLALVVVAILVFMASCDGAGSRDGIDVTLTSPSADTAYTAGTITLQVAVTGEADAVELHRDGAVMVTLEPPYAYSWDTRAEPEGRYVLTAVAHRGSATVTSEPRTVIVDRTAPTVAGRSPQPDAENVWIGDPITVRFSEPINEATVSSTSVELAVADGTLLETDLVLGDDAEAVTIVPSALPDLPVALKLTLRDTITDRAGNGLLPPDPWSWTLPVWQRLGEPLNVDSNISAQHPRIATNGGEPVVVWLETIADSKPPADLYVKRWGGSTWAELGGSLNDDQGRVGPMYGHPDVAVDDAGHPVVAWPQPIEHLGYVQRWDGASWQTFGGPFNVDPEKGTNEVSLALDADGRPWIAWREGDFLGYALYVARWTGAAWELVGKPRDRTGHEIVGHPELVFDAEQRPIVAWIQDVDAEGDVMSAFADRWTGAGWEPLGGGLGGNALFRPYVRLAVADDGTVYAAYVDQRQDDTALLVVRTWDESSGSWQFFDQVSGGDAVAYGVLVMDHDDRPMAAWWVRSETAEGPVSEFHVRTWDGFAFRPVGTPIEASRFDAHFDLAIGASGAPILATPVQNEGSGPIRLAVWRHNAIP